MLVKAFLTSLFAAGVALAQDYTINTPAAVIQCQPANINWMGGTAPYILAVIPGGQPSAPALVTLADGTSDTSYVWTVNLAEGTSITLRLTDSVGDIVYSSPVTIQAGSSTDCLNSTATSAAGAAGATGASGSASGASSSAASGASGASSGVASATSAMSSAASSAMSGASSMRSGASSSAQSATSRSGASSSTSGSATPVSSGAGAANSSPNAAISKAAPGVFLAAVGGLFALF